MRKAEVFLSSFAALACAGLTIYLWGWISTFQPLWPFPALYLIELVLLAFLAWYFSFRDLPRSAMVIWGITGVFLAFAILASFSIGLFYYPFVVFYAAIALLVDLRQKRISWTHIGMLFVGGLVQAALIVLILQLILQPASAG